MFRKIFDNFLELLKDLMDIIYAIKDINKSYILLAHKAINYKPSQAFLTKIIIYFTLR